jgi:hypothetical protein
MSFLFQVITVQCILWGFDLISEKYVTVKPIPRICVCDVNQSLIIHITPISPHVFPVMAHYYTCEITAPPTEISLS